MWKIVIIRETKLHKNKIGKFASKVKTNYSNKY